MTADNFNILIAGLGLMGGSLARALRGFKNAGITAFDKDAGVIARALSEGVIDAGGADAAELLPDADLVIVCLYPADTVNFINNGRFKSGAVVTDICGIKKYVTDSVTNPEVCYIGGHPMAGRELSGYGAAEEELFLGASYILTPGADAPESAVELLRSMAGYIGCRRVEITTPEKHDAMIAYTSQLMHVAASALCDNPLLEEAGSYSAGSLRDCTRVANINSEMWSELFLKNRAALTARITELERSMDKIKTLLNAEDSAGLRAFLEKSAERKRRFLA